VASASLPDSAPTRPLLSFAAVSRSYERRGRRREVLQEVSFELYPGQTLGIWGKRGAGKSTLLSIAAGLLLADSGCVRFMGEDFSEMPDRRLATRRRTQIGWVQRKPPRMQLCAGEWIALAADPQHADRQACRDAHEALQRVGAGECYELRWSDLTDGERTLVGIAGALVRKPRLLIADDPAVALDAAEREQVMRMLAGLAQEQGMAMLISAPDLQALAYTKRRGSLSGGRLILAAEAGETAGPDDGEAQVIDMHARRHVERDS
jgi:putative ABC transport system ATP-binding protein